MTAQPPPLDLHGQETDASPQAPIPPWREVDLHRAADGTWTLDGVGGLPGVVVASLVQWGRESRLALFGKVQRVLVHDFGPGVGRHTVVVCEKWAGVYLQGDASPFDAQGIHLNALGAWVNG